MNSLRYLLDTNILSDLIRHPNGAVMQRIAAVGESSICTSIVVACEMRFGAAKRQSPRLSAKVDQLLAHIEVLPLNGDCDRHYAMLRANLEQSGTPIGPNDMLLAAQARSLGLVIVTDNLREFSRVPGLLAENWLNDPAL